MIIDYPTGLRRQARELAAFEQSLLAVKPRKLFYMAPNYAYVTAPERSMLSVTGIVTVGRFSPAKAEGNWLCGSSVVFRFSATEAGTANFAVQERSASHRYFRRKKGRAAALMWAESRSVRVTNRTVR